MVKVNKLRGDVMSEKSMDILKIRELLPHRYPFLFIDKVLEVDVENEYVKAIKNVSINEPFFQGHFPDYPIMPGVLIIEAMAQAAGIGLKIIFPEYRDRLFVLAGVDKVKFRNPVFPGDTLILEARGFKKKGFIIKTSATAKVGDKLVAQAELMAGIR